MKDKNNLRKEKRNLNTKWHLLQNNQNANTTLLHSHDKLLALSIYKVIMKYDLWVVYDVGEVYFLSLYMNYFITCHIIFLFFNDEK